MRSPCSIAAELAQLEWLPPGEFELAPKYPAAAAWMARMAATAPAWGEAHTLLKKAAAKVAATAAAKGQGLAPSASAAAATGEAKARL
jgi:hypothetical protein